MLTRDEVRELTNVYPNFSRLNQSHLEALDIIDGLKAQIAELKNDGVMNGAIIEAIMSVWFGEEVSDFMISFPVVRNTWDLKQEVRQLEAELAREKRNHRLTKQTAQENASCWEALKLCEAELAACKKLIRQAGFVFSMPEEKLTDMQKGWIGEADAALKDEHETP